MSATAAHLPISFIHFIGFHSIYQITTPYHLLKSVLPVETPRSSCCTCTCIRCSSCLCRCQARCNWDKSWRLRKRSYVIISSCCWNRCFTVKGLCCSSCWQGQGRIFLFDESDCRFPRIQLVVGVGDHAWGGAREVSVATGVWKKIMIIENRIVERGR